MKGPNPCQGCGGPKPAGRGRRFCDACLDLRQPVWERAMRLRKLEGRKEVRREARGGVPTPRERAQMAPEGTKWCSRCERYLPLTDFGKNAGQKAGRASYCVLCYSTYIHAQRLKNVFGMTPEDYDALFELQGGRCAICQKKPRARRLAVDHDHNTDEIRGLLCTRCNHKILGAASENPAVLRRAARYLEAPPAVTREPVESLGDWDGIRLDAYAEEAERAAEGGRWAVVIESGEDVRDAYVTVPLWLFCEMVGDTTQAGAA